jgi:MFS family permease
MRERVRLREAFARSGYRRLWVARTVSQWGDAFATVALGLLVLERTGSGLGVAGVVASEIVPVLLLAPVAGVVVDRLSPVRVMIAADVVRCVLAGLLPLVAGSVPAIYLVAAGMAAASAFFNPAAGAVLPALVEERELVAANSGIWTAAVLSQIVLAPTAGLLVSGVGSGAAFGVNAASFAVSALVLLGLRVPRPARAARPAGSWAILVREGLALVLGDRVLRALAAGQVLAALSAGATGALLVVLAREHLGMDARGYGLMLAAIGVGAAVGPLLLARLVADPRRPAFVFGPYLLRAAVDLLLAATRTPVLAVGALAGYGVGTSTGAVTFNSLLQAQTPSHARGRVFASFDLLWQTGRLASLALGGVLADAAGIHAVYLVGGGLLLAAAGVGWAGLRQQSAGAAH